MLLFELPFALGSHQGLLADRLLSLVCVVRGCCAILSDEGILQIRNRVLSVVHVYLVLLQLYWLVS